MASKNVARVRELSDGKRTHKEIANLVGMSASGVKKIVAQYGFPSRPVGAKPGSGNHQWRGGRMIDLDGYVLLKNKNGRMLEHRQIMERVLGRPLGKLEVVDHIDGLTLHNDPSNLRVFATNADHLRETLHGRNKRTSKTGMANIGTRSDLGQEFQPVDIHRLRKARGDVRRLAILRAALQLGIDSPFLSGTKRWLVADGIDPFSRPSLERALADLNQRYEQDLLL